MSSVYIVMLDVYKRRLRLLCPFVKVAVQKRMEQILLNARCTVSSRIKNTEGVALNRSRPHLLRPEAMLRAQRGNRFVHRNDLHMNYLRVLAGLLDSLARMVFQIDRRHGRQGKKFEREWVF